MTDSRPLRILLSEKTHQRIGQAVRTALGARAFEPVIAATALGGVPGDADLAFISRDVTGRSTKHVIQEPTEAFYESLRASPALQWVHVHSIGADRPIFAELKARGVRVTTSPGVNAEVVAQTALAGILSLAREFPLLQRAQRRHEWVSLVATGQPADLAGQTAVIVGWGAIGQRLAAFLRMLGLSVVAVRSAAEPAAGPDIDTVAFEDLGAVAGRADWLVIACPLTDRTRRLVDRGIFAALKPGARLVNVGRGEVIAEPDLIEALRGGRLAGAYLDVFEHEPLGADSPLWDMDNVIVTPHSAGHSDGNEARVDRMFLDHLREWAR